MSVGWVDRWEVNITYQTMLIQDRPWVPWGKVILKGVSSEEAVRRAQTLKRLFEPEGLKVSLTAWAEEGRDISLE